MALEVDYVPIANGVGANVESQAQYVLDLGSGGSLQNGYEAGLAKSNQVNKTLRQSSMISAAVANFIANTLSINVIDDGNLAALTANLTSAIGGVGGSQQIYKTTAGAVVLSAGFFGNVILAKTSPATTAITLPPSPANPLQVNVIDGAGNAQTYNATISTSDGSTINGQSTYVLAVNNGRVYLQFVVSANNWVIIG